MNKYNKIIAFFGGLLTFLRQDKFSHDLAEKVIALFGEAEEFLHYRTKLELKELDEAYHHSRSRVAFAEEAFEALAPYLRAREARGIVGELIRLSRAYSDDNIFVHVANRRLLSEQEGKDGPAVVTVVVNEYRAFENLISCVQPPVVHGSFGSKAPTI